MRPGDARQWRFLTAGAQLRADETVTLHNDAHPAGSRSDQAYSSGPDSAAPGSDPTDPTDRATGLQPPVDLVFKSSTTVVLRRTGSSARPVCGGERVALEVVGVGYLAAGEPGDREIVVLPEPAVEWVVAGVAPGVAVPVDKPVALFDTAQGDYLICRCQTVGHTLGWKGGTAVFDEDSLTLPVPSRLCPPEGVPGDVQLSGAVAPTREADPAAGLLLLLDPEEGHALGGHLRRRVPASAEHLVADSMVGAVACRWSAAGDPSVVELPPTGSRLWAQGPLVADPGISLCPVRALAWALDGDATPVGAVPGGTGWPATTITWWVLGPALPDDVVGGWEPAVFYLPLPSRDGEPGSVTTLTPVSPRQARRSGREAAGQPVVRPALVPGVPGPGRMVRIVVGQVQGGGPVVTGCAVRVHLPSQPTDP